MQKPDDAELLTDIRRQGTAITQKVRELRSNHWNHVAEGNDTPLVSTSHTDMLNAYRKIKGTSGGDRGSAHRPGRGDYERRERENNLGLRALAFAEASRRFQQGDVRERAECRGLLQLPGCGVPFECRPRCTWARAM